MFAVFYEIGHRFQRRFLVGTRFLYLFVRRAVRFGELYYQIPIFRLGDAHHRFASHFLVRPESVAYVVVDKHFRERALPFVGVVACLAHIHRQACLVAESYYLVDELGRRLASVAVAGEHDVVVESPVGEKLERIVPFRAANQYYVVAVGLAYLHGAFFVDFHKPLFQFLFVLPIVRNRLVHYLVAEYHRLVLVAFGYAAPYLVEEFLTPAALEKPWVAVAVVDVVACLSAGSVVHVEYQVESCLAAPFNHVVDVLVAVLRRSESHIVLVGEKFVVQRQADGVAACGFDKHYVVLGHIIVLELFPKVGCRVGSDELAEHFVDEMRGIGVVETEHIAFRIEPVAEVCAFDEQACAVRVTEIGSVDCYELCVCRGNGEHRDGA